MEQTYEELRNLIIKELNASLLQDDTLPKLAERLRGGKGTFRDANLYARKISKHYSNAMLKYVTADTLQAEKLKEDVAKQVIQPMLKNVYKMAADAAKHAQKAQNVRAELGLEPVEAEPSDFQEERYLGVMTGFEELEMARRYLDDCTENYALCAVDDVIQKNAEFQYSLGLEATVTRTATGSCCDWCRGLAGTYKYEAVRYGSDVWRRHRGCRCVLEYEAHKAGSFREHKTVWGHGDRWKWTASRGRK